jgi:hypothetical protein
MSIKPFPILVLRLEGGPDDGETRLMLPERSVVPPEALEPSRGDPDGPRGRYVRQPELDAPWTWRYVWKPAD